MSNYTGKHSENICINCKRCTNSDEYQCPWADHSAPVEGWTATPGNTYTFHLKSGKTKTVVGKRITACPLFIKDKEFTTYMEAAKVMGEALHRHPTNIVRQWDKYVALYEETTGKKLPAWVHLRSVDEEI